MRIFIAYKYTNVKNKNELKVNLEYLVQLLENKGHSTFLLNRDAKAWGKKHVSTFKNIFTIIGNISKSDAMVAYVSSDVVSKGILFEFIFSKIMGKRIILALDKTVEKNNRNLLVLATETVVFDGIKDLEAKLNKIL